MPTYGKLHDIHGFRGRRTAWEVYQNSVYAELYEAYAKGSYSKAIELLDNYASTFVNGSSKSREGDKDKRDSSNSFSTDKDDHKQRSDRSSEKDADSDNNAGNNSDSNNKNNRHTTKNVLRVNLTHTTNTHVLLVRALCYQQEHKWTRVESLSTEIIRPLCFEAQCRQKTTTDASFCLILGLWLRSLAYEEQRKWGLALKDLEHIKTLIQNNDVIPFYYDGLLSPFLRHMAPLISRLRVDTINFNLHCVTDRLRRVSDMVAKEDYTNLSQAFELVVEDNKSYHELAKTFHYRLCLKRPIHPYIHLNMWYTMDLMLVSEIGLYKKGDMDKVEGYSLDCEVLNIRSGNDNNDFCVEVRPLSEEACEWSELTNIQWPGIHGGKGGLEFRVVSKKLTTNDDFYNRQCNNWRYLHIYPVAEMVRNDGHGKDSFESINRIEHCKIVPLLVGPIEIGHCYQHHSSCAHHQEPLDDLGDEANFTDDSLSNSSPDSHSPNSSSPSSPSPDSPQFDSPTSSSGSTSASSQRSWITDTYLINNYRAFSLPHKKTFLIQEVWDGRVSGKVWDSAFIVLQFMKDSFMKDRSFLFGKRILDLSTGTGLIGLYLAAFCSVMAQHETTAKVPKTNFVLTDLQHALKLINKNRLLNKYLINEAKVSTEVVMLEWGRVNKAKKLGTFDIVLASDVVYEPELFDVLIGTLCAVCTSNHTKIYLGYKRRALSVEEEGRFFKKLARKFKVSLVDGIATVTNEQKVRIYELRR
ncbi:3646_t:CDS:2 [Paraglomus brasilianum]|uniref:3646_t:CDS:1 n=1 Tax=Paraglomus brasilianum TaxID=144538 RepID=A0A9N9FD40_9GLOM|nr:3646_t:CDS:2 [Paraglomus brasilianum]